MYPLFSSFRLRPASLNGVKYTVSRTLIHQFRKARPLTLSLEHKDLCVVKHWFLCYLDYSISMKSILSFISLYLMTVFKSMISAMHFFILIQFAKFLKENLFSFYNIVLRNIAYSSCLFIETP